MLGPYPEIVTKISCDFIKILEKYLPDLVKKKFDSCGYQDREGSPALQRMEACVYIELMKAGVFNEYIGSTANDRGLHEQGVKDE